MILWIMSIWLYFWLFKDVFDEKQQHNCSSKCLMWISCDKAYDWPIWCIWHTMTSVNDMTYILNPSQQNSLPTLSHCLEIVNWFLCLMSRWEILFYLNQYANENDIKLFLDIVNDLFHQLIGYLRKALLDNLPIIVMV